MKLTITNSDLEALIDLTLDEQEGNTFSKATLRLNKDHAVGLLRMILYYGAINIPQHGTKMFYVALSLETLGMIKLNVHKAYQLSRYSQALL